MDSTIIIVSLVNSNSLLNASLVSRPVSHCGRFEGSSSLEDWGRTFMNFCRAGVKMRMVPSTETVRKAQRKILSNT